MATKLISVIVALLVIVYIVTSPNHAADMANSAWDGLVKGAHGLRDFVNQLGS